MGERTKSVPFLNSRDIANYQRNVPRHHRLENEPEFNKPHKLQHGKGRGRGSGSKNGFEKKPGPDKGLDQVASSKEGVESKPKNKETKGNDRSNQKQPEFLKGKSAVNTKIPNVKDAVAEESKKINNGDKERSDKPVEMR